MTTTLLEPPHCVSNNLHQTARAVSRIYAREMQPTGLRRSQFSLLGYIHAHGPVSLTDLAERMYMERTTLTRNLRPLERAGYVKRVAAEDARVKLVALTAAGRRKRSAARKYWRRAQAKVLADFGEDRWQELEAALHVLRRINA